MASSAPPVHVEYRSGLPPVVVVVQATAGNAEMLRKLRANHQLHQSAPIGRKHVSSCLTHRDQQLVLSESEDD